MAVLWPTVKARLVAALPDLSGFTNVTVYDGPPTETPAVYITVGYVQESEFGGSFDMPDSTIDGLREESGSVVFEIVKWDGDSNLPTLQDDVFALLNTIDAWVRADQTLGVLPAASTATLGATYVPVLAKEAATTARLVVTLSYFARH